MVHVLEQVGSRNAAVRGRGARIVGDEPVHVKVVGDINCAICIAPRVVSERAPHGGRSLPGPVTRLVDERRRKICEALKGQSRGGLGDILLGAASEEDAVSPSIRGCSAYAWMCAIRNGTVNLVYDMGKCALREIPGGDRAPKIARRKSRPAHIGGERDGRYHEERKDAKHN